MHQHPQRHLEHCTTTACSIIMATVLLMAMAGALVAGPLGQVAGAATTSVTLYAAPNGTATSGCTSQSTDVCTIQGAIGAAESSTYDDDDVTVVLEHDDGSACSSSDQCTFEPEKGDSFSVDDTNSGSLTIKGNSATDTILQGNGSSVLSDLHGSTTPVVISDLEITGDTSYESGGGIDDTASATLTITDSTISGNTGKLGGGITDASGALTITGSTISGNTATFGGGISDTASAALTITGSTISGNLDGGPGGGGIYDTSAALTISSSTISGNTNATPVPGAAGGISDTASGALIITGSTITRNPSGGISDTASSTLIITDSTITRNPSGGISDTASSTLIITDSTISGNTASDGSGIDDTSAALIITDSTISGNTASDAGGGISDTASSTLIITDSTISGNTASDGAGGGIDNTRGTTMVTGSIVAHNTASTDENCSGTITDAGYDLSNGSSCGFAASDDSADDAALDLGTLGSYGGLTDTVPLLGTTSSDQGIGFIPDTATATLGGTTISLCGDSQTSAENSYGGAELSLDQRGDPRLPDDATSCDAGAYELQPSELAFRTAPPARSVAGADFTVAVSVEDVTGTLVSASSVSVDLAITSGTGTTGATLSCTTNPVDASSGIATFSCSINDPATNYTLSATSTGLTSATSRPFAITTPPSPPSPSPVVPTPTLSAISPSSGSTAGGTVVTLSGSDLCDPSAVDFGSTPGTGVSVNGSCTTITVTDPSAAAGVVQVTVVTPSGTSNAEPFTYTTPPSSPTPAPTLSAISPTSGSPSGGEVVTLVGTNLCDVTSVDFGTTPGTNISVNASCTTLSVTDPPGSGTVSVVVHTSSGSVTAPIAFTYVAPGYWMASANGSVYSFGGAKFYGSLPSIGVIPNAPIVAMADTPDHEGYWLFGADGGVFAFGNAKFYGSVPGVLGPQHRTLNEPIVAAEAMPNGKGYRLFAADGGVFDFGDAAFVGSLPCSAPGSPGGLCIIPNKPIESAVSDPLGEGYWLVGGDGGVFALGDAPFYGSLGDQAIPFRIVSMASTPDGGGYWVFGNTGSVDTYGDAVSYGSMLGKVPPSAPIAYGAATTNDHGYWLFGQNGGVYAFGSAPFDGSLQSIDVSSTSPIVSGVGF